MYMCPHCNSKEIKKFTIVYQEGYSTGTSKYEGKHTFIEGRTYGKTSYQTQTNLAKRCSPPKKPYPTIYFHIFAIITGFIIYAYIIELIPQNILKITIGWIENFQITKTFVPTIVGLLLVVLSITVMYTLRYFLYSKKLWKKYRVKKLNYPKSWICLSCGQKFLIT